VIESLNMWLATKYGFYSIVQKRDGYIDKQLYQVRARVRRDLENLLELTKLDREILAWPKADYRYRFLASFQDLIAIMNSLAESLDYDDFKATITKRKDQSAKLTAYHDLWRNLAQLQKQGPG
jgi:hypothetical protein